MQGGKGFVELLEGGDCHDFLGSQHIGDNGEHGGGGDETVFSLEQRWARKSILDQTYFQSLLPQTLPYQHHTFILHLVLFHPASDCMQLIQCIHLHMRKGIPRLTSQCCLVTEWLCVL